MQYVNSKIKILMVCIFSLSFLTGFEGCKSDDSPDPSGIDLFDGNGSCSSSSGTSSMPASEFLWEIPIGEKGAQPIAVYKDLFITQIEVYVETSGVSALHYEIYTTSHPSSNTPDFSFDKTSGFAGGWENITISVNISLPALSGSTIYLVFWADGGSYFTIVDGWLNIPPHYLATFDLNKILDDNGSNNWNEAGVFEADTKIWWNDGPSCGGG